MSYAMQGLHCPNCGQQQVSRETKFCSRCGLPLTGVRMVLENGGAVPIIERTKTARFFNKRNGVVFSISWFIIFTMFLTAFFGILNAPDELVAIVAITGFFGSILSLLISLVFFPSSKSTAQTLAAFEQTTASQTQFAPMPERGALPPKDVSAAAAFVPRAGMWLDTKELSPSETSEGKTKLLNDEEARQ